MRKTLEKIRKSYSFGANDLKHEVTLANNLLRKESKLPVSLEQFFFIYSYNLLKELLLIVIGSSVAVTLPATSASCERSFSKMKLLKTIPGNSMTSKRLGNIDPLSVERYELKNRFR